MSFGDECGKCRTDGMPPWNEEPIQTKVAQGSKHYRIKQQFFFSLRVQNLITHEITQGYPQDIQSHNLQQWTRRFKGAP